MTKCRLCDQTVIGRGLCRKHYYQFRNSGGLDAFDKKHKPIKDRLREKFDVSENGCWLWNGHKNQAGYPMIWLNGKAVRAHREMYKLFKNDLTDDLVLCHTCDTPSCVNPAHLFTGTRLENNRDAVEKKRNAFGMKNGHTRLTVLQISEIFADTRAQSEIAATYGINQSHVSRIKNAKTRSKG